MRMPMSSPRAQGGLHVVKLSIQQGLHLARLDVVAPETAGTHVHHGRRVRPRQFFGRGLAARPGGCISQHDQDWARGICVRPKSVKDQFTLYNADRSWVDDSCFDSEVVELLPFAEVLAIMDEANLCKQRMQDEGSWNQEVNHPLLKAALRTAGRRGLVDFLGW